MLGILVLTIAEAGKQEFEASLAAATKDAPIAAAPAYASTETPARTIEPGYGGGYAYGHCTYYVASRKKVPRDWGSAGNWFYAAQADGYSTGSEPRPGAIAWTYGHVAYVEQVNGGRVFLSEMNYAGWNVISHRWAPASAFQYIY